MVNIVFTGRNDNHGGKNFKEQLFEILEWNTYQFNRYGLDYLFWFVEWGLESGKEWLSPELCRKFKNCRCILVPNDVVQSAQSEHVKYQQFTAKNAAISRITDGLIIATNTDILFPKELIEALRNLQPDSKSFYRAPRHDFDENDRLSPFNEEFHFSHKYDMGVNYGQAAGDFFAGTPEVWNKLGGYSESPYHMYNIDSELVIKAMSFGLKPVVLSPVFHRDHPDSTKFNTTWKEGIGLYDWHLSTGKKIMPRNRSWGFRHFKLTIVDENISMLVKDSWEIESLISYHEKLENKSGLFQNSIKEKIIKSEKFIQEERLREARILLDEILTEDHLNTDALNNYAVIHILEKEFQSANEKINIVLRIDPNNDIALDNSKVLENIIYQHKGNS